MRIVLAVLALLLFSPSAQASTRLAGPVVGEVLDVVDGDTVRARLNVWVGTEVTVLVRLSGIDAPELKGRCPAERARAIEAKAELARFFAEHRLVLTDITLEKYAGRVLARAARADGTDAGAHLLNASLVRPYGGGRRGGWCG
jgi:micrococcal nuclease